MESVNTRSIKKISKIKEQIHIAVNTMIQPYKELPSENVSNQETGSRINPHDLFLFYTADIIKEDIIFIR
jgi:hypothetical protein